VVRAIGERQARRYALTAEKFDAAEAFRIGLVHELVAPDALDARVNEILGALMLTSDAAVIEAKRLVRDVTGQPLTDALLADTAQRIARVRASADGREGVASFLDKRKPRWVVEFEQQSSGSDEDEEM
jgi:methylglutaconyl-CoA hydratase